ncbi:MAG: response regulator [Ignavibacteriaceae bacterium]
MGKELILVVDDEKAALEVASCILEDAGYGVIKSLRPLDGIKKAIEQKPDLVLLDWYMPQMDGLQTLQKLKADKITKEIPVIIATGIKTESEDLKQALDSGAVDFIRKPIDEIELLARVKAALRLVNYYNENRQHLKTIHKQEKKIINQKAEEYKKELEFKKQELINNALQLLQIMENTYGMISELKKINLEISDDNSDRIKRVIAKYQNTSFEIKWAEYEKRFEEVHSDYYQKLLRDFPALSANERKLCVYFKMDMENKDIAALTFSSYEAVRKARVRLRHKLNLSSEDNIVEFLNRY